MQPSRLAFLSGSTALLAASPPTPKLPSLESAADPAGCAAPSPVAAMLRLVQGNDRFATGRMRHAGQTPQGRGRVAGRDCPFATIVDCADARVAPEILFDQGLGDLFVCRVAGNVADTPVTGSVEYALQHFRTSLVVVLAHERCGAVGAALDALRTGVLPPASVGGLVREIIPNVGAVPVGPDQWAQAIAANAAAVAAALRRSPLLAPAIAAGKLRVVAAAYGLGSGRVTFSAG